MPSDHAILAPSAAKRWLKCTPSARFEAQEPEQDSVYAREGTLAHAVAEYLLKNIYLARMPKAVYEDILPEWLKLTGDAENSQLLVMASELGMDPAENDLFHEMLRTVHDNYVALVWEDFLSARELDEFAVLLVEHRYKLDPIVPESFGSSDAIIIAGATCHVYDLKYGKGVMVSAKENPQMRLYAVGALKGPCELYEIEKVSMTIIQPRLDHVSTDMMTVQELLGWAEEVVRPAATLAFAGIGDYVPGDHCQFCKVAHKCPALAERARTFRQRYAQPALLSEIEVAEALSCCDELKVFIKAVEDHAQTKLMEGKVVPGFKLVEGRSLSRIENTEAVIAGLEKAGIDPSACIKPRELKPQTDLKRILRTAAFNEFVAPYVVKPQGKPTVVKETDPRPVFEPRQTAEQDFKA